jgi:2-polyprenyl-3-methyl-5-hydroxy-6-metoxy-1,4-benzoquinol methylase
MMEQTEERSARARREIEHGRKLADADTEAVWGWGTPAGMRRARRRADLLAAGAGLGPGVKALEIGCGTGLFTELLAASGAGIVAVDISEELLAKARGRGLNPERVRFIRGRFEDLELYGPFDAVLGSSVLHHLDVEASLHRIFDLLRPGGRLTFAEPNLLNPQIFAERAFSFLPCFAHVSADETAFVRWRLADRLKRTGFEEVAITPFDWLHPATPPVLIPKVQRLGRLLERLPGVAELAGSLWIRARRPDRDRV